MAPALTPLELRCFGPPAARLAGAGSTAPPELRWRKHIALLVYLALSPNRSRSRDHLLGLLWAEQPEHGARKSLNMAVRRLRVALGDERLRSEGDTLALSDQALDVDALRLLAQAQGSDDALELLRGEFLEGFHIDDAPEFEDWMTRERERYRALATTTMVAAGERHLTAGHGDAADLARRALVLAPRSEPAIRLLMRAAALAGDSAAALTAFHDFAQILQNELGEQPSRALVALADRIRTRSWQPQGTATVDDKPLVGRDAVLRQAFDTITRGMTPAGGPQALVIRAAPGMGRSRLVAECVRRLGLDGALVLHARPVESDHDASWSALRLLTRAGLLDAPGLAAARRESLSALAALVPALAERFAPREIRDVADMGTALADVLRAITDESPVVIALDDAHWSDGASIAALDAALAGLTRAPLVLIVTIAEGAVDLPRALLSLQNDVGRAIPGATVRLDPLTANDIAELVATTANWCPDASACDRLTRRLIFETAGNPFYLVTLLAALAKASTWRQDMLAWPPLKGTYDAPLPFSIPNTVRHALALRVAELPREEIDVLRAASICGQTLELDVLAEMTGKDPRIIQDGLLAFERRHLIQFDGRRYTFVAPLVAQVVRAECMTRGERHALQERAVAALAGRSELDSRALRVQLLAEIRPDQQTLDLALDVGAEALQSGARRIAQRAIAIADVLSRDEKFDRTRVEEMRTRMAALP